MRGRDPESGEFLDQSRSQQRREALEVLGLGERLSVLSDAQLAKLPIPDGLLPHIRETRRITSHGARKRQLAFLAKQMRREDDATLNAIRDSLDAGGEAARSEVAAMHQVESWRDRLLADGDAALTQLLDLHPHADGQSLRQLVRNALDERKRDKPPRAYRELFRQLRGLLLQPGDSLDEDTASDGGR